MELLANLAMNPNNVVQLYDFGVVESTLQQFKVYHNREEQECEARKQVIRAIGNCSINREFSRDLVLKSDFLLLLKRAIETATNNKNFEEICYLLDVLSNILTHSW